MRCLLLVIYFGVHLVAVVTPRQREFFTGSTISPGDSESGWVIRNRRYEQPQRVARHASTGAPREACMGARRTLGSLDVHARWSELSDYARWSGRADYARLNGLSDYARLNGLSDYARLNGLSDYARLSGR